MSSEIATWGMIRSKVPSFPAPVAGRENECLTKSEILSLGGENVRIEGSYGDGECVMLDNVLTNIITYNECFTANGWTNRADLSFNRSVHDIDLDILAAKKKYVNGVYVGVEEYYEWYISGYTGSPPSWMKATKTSGHILHLRVEYNTSGANRTYGIVICCDRINCITIYVHQSQIL